jgi:O-antigen/teichoic acid export membrane protein
VLLTWLGTSAEVGIYHAATQPAFVFTTILIGFNAILVPMIADLAEQRESDRLIELYRISTKWGLYTSVPFFLTLIFVPHAMIETVFGAEYLAGVTPMVILAVGKFIHAGAGAVGPLLNMTGYERRWMALAGVVLLLDLALARALIPPMGMTGAAIATAIAISTLLAAGVWQIRRVHGAWPYDRRHLKGLAATAVTAAALWVLRRAGLEQPAVELVLALVVSTSVFGGVLLALGLDDEDRQFVRQIRARVSRRGR